MGKAKGVRIGEYEIQVRTITTQKMLPLIAKIRRKEIVTEMDYLQASLTEEDWEHLNTVDWEQDHVLKVNEMLIAMMEVNPFLKEAPKTEAEKNFQEPSIGRAETSATPQAK